LLKGSFVVSSGLLQEVEMIDTTKSGIELAIEAAGSQEALAAAVGCTQQNVSWWKRQGFVPVEHLVVVEQSTGVSRALLINPRISELLSNNTFWGGAP
jgi:DNA-binding transcriptional regulator YdaS (Cro superfamily)